MKPNKSKEEELKRFNEKLFKKYPELQENLSWSKSLFYFHKINWSTLFIYYYIYTPTTYTPNMSNSQHRIVAHLLALAEQSTIMQKHASALCSGKKMLYTAVNNRRSKFGKDIVCCGHSEAICVRRYLSCSFKGKSKHSLVLAGLRGNRKS